MNMLTAKRAIARRATTRRRRTQSGQEIVEFGLVAVLFVPMLIGSFVVGMNLIRSIQCSQVCRDLDSMYIHGGDVTEARARPRRFPWPTTSSIKLPSLAR
jgi:hypothetical protein